MLLASDGEKGEGNKFVVIAVGEIMWKSGCFACGAKICPSTGGVDKKGAFHPFGQPQVFHRELSTSPQFAVEMWKSGKSPRRAAPLHTVGLQGGKGALIVVAGVDIGVEIFDDLSATSG